MWEALEKYREVIINGLDLLSFLFVTPELLRYSGFVLGRVAYWIGFASIFVLYLIIFQLIYQPFSNVPGLDPSAERPPAVEPSAVMVILMLGGSLLYMLVIFAFTAVSIGLVLVMNRVQRWWEAEGPEVANFISRQAFVLGVAIFFSARLISFIAAVHSLIK